MLHEQYTGFLQLPWMFSKCLLKLKHLFWYKECIFLPRLQFKQVLFIKNIQQFKSKSFDFFLGIWNMFYIRTNLNCNMNEISYLQCKNRYCKNRWYFLLNWNSRLKLAFQFLLFQYNLHLKIKIISTVFVSKIIMIIFRSLAHSLTYSLTTERLVFWNFLPCL